MNAAVGKLVVVATPIGNLADLSARAADALRSADLIAAEDTRHTSILLRHIGISKPLLSCHEHNEARRTEEIVARCAAGQTVALVTDAGTPTVSDPGARVVRAAIDRGIAVEVIPGPSAVTAALAGSGLAGGPFLAYGFLPHKTAHRRKVLAQLASLPCTLVFFESPYRLVKSLADMRELLGDRRACIARELTKKFEEYCRGTLSELLQQFAARRVKGEITVVVEGHRE